MAPVNAPFSCRRVPIRATRSEWRHNDFNEGAIAARAEIVDGACEEFLARAGFAKEKDRRARGRGELHLGQGALQRRAFADNFLEIEFTAISSSR